MVVGIITNWLIITVATIITSSIITTGNDVVVPVTVKGRILCDNEPIKYVKVDGFGGFGNLVVWTRTDINGYFETTSYGTSDDFENVETKLKIDYTGLLTNLYADDDTNFVLNVSILISGKYYIAYDITSVKSPSNGIIDFGTLNYGSSKCRAYKNMASAMFSFATKVNIILPTFLEIRLQTLIDTTVPQSRMNEIDVPVGYQLSLTRAHYELAKIMRHNLDGNLEHYNNDALLYKYNKLNHDCNILTNYGFAFEEGFPLWYTGGCVGHKGTDYRYEGNVVYALRELVIKCAATANKMFQVLDSPGVIHSFQDFNKKYYAIYDCKI